MTMTAEDFAEQLKQAKERGQWEGEIKAKLEMLLAQGASMSAGMADVRGLVQAQSNSISEIRATYNAHREDLLETKEELRKIQSGYVTQADLEKALQPLKALADRLNNWAWQLALASLGGSALTLTAGYGLLRSAGLLR